MFHADDRQADMTKLIVGFRNFAESAGKDRVAPMFIHHKMSA